MLLPVADGSVRIVCQFPADQVTEGPPPARALAFDADGTSLPGWPVDVPCCFTGRVIGDVLTLHGRELLGSDFPVGEPIPGSSWIVAIDASGSTRTGATVPWGTDCCNDRSVVGPDGAVYGATGHYDPEEYSVTTSTLWGIGPAGVLDVYPVSIAGAASIPSFDAVGHLVVTVGTRPPLGTSRVLAIDPDEGRASDISAELFVETVESGLECATLLPPPPLVSGDGTVFVSSGPFVDLTILALDRSLDTIEGWPYRPGTPLERPDHTPGQDGLNCRSVAVPAVSDDGVLYLPLQARASDVGGSIVAVGSDGRVQAGWPVELSRAGSGFWSVDVGTDGTVYALAVEPEGRARSSATILAIAPDGTVLWTTTIVAP